MVSTPQPIPQPTSQPARLPYDVGTSLAGAIIEHPTLGFLLQLRDEQASTHPLHWSLFGGHMEGDEAPATALWRELAEELQLQPQQAVRCQLVQRNPRPHGGQQFIFHVLTHATTDDLVLGEGKAMRYVTRAQLAAALSATGVQSLFGHGFAANIAQIFRDHFAGRRDGLDGSNGSTPTP